GPISNFFTYIARGDLALSISMTVISTLSGLLLIPLLLFIYTAPFLDAATGNNLAIPHGKIVAILLAILVPVGLGMALRKRSRRWARRMERSGSVAGFIVIIMIIASILLRQSDTLLQIEPGIYVAGALLGPIGFILGYLSARIMGLEAAQRSAVSLETGSQNAPLVLGIIVISFPPQIQSEILVAPILYGVAIVPFTALAACLFRRGR
ncbi:MAG: bile acid:sodium symporter, partial [Alcanivorax sp.]|nr:bile acid:sodium symporter [Alcanivorax sp.]